MTDTSIEKVEYVKADLTKKLTQREENQTDQMDKVLNGHNNDRKGWEQLKAIQTDRCNELEKNLHKANLELNFVKTQYERLAECLKEQMAKVVHQTVMEHMRFIEGSRGKF